MALLETYRNKKIYFIGIGGISMSGIATIFHRQGAVVSGIDWVESDNTRRLRDMGIHIDISRDAPRLEGQDIVVETGAVRPESIEHKAAIASGLPIISRSKLLQEINAAYPISVGVAGTHGKTSTTAMTAAMLTETQIDPTVHVGAHVEFMRGTVRVGDGPIFVTEADEYQEQFLNFPSHIAVVLNIDMDHADYYRDIQHIYKAFTQYIHKLPEDGRLAGCLEDPMVEQLLSEARCPVIGYGFRKGDWQAWDDAPDQNGCFGYTVVYKGKPLGAVKLSAPGRHNALNSLGALAIASEAMSRAKNISLDDVLHEYMPAFLRGLHDFTGADRRFQRMGDVRGATVYIDYAHHPSEITATIDTARMLKAKGKLWAVYQPHTYSRTKSLFQETIQALAAANRVVLLDIYAAREPDPGDIHSTMVVEALQKQGVDVTYAASFEDAQNFVCDEVQENDIVLILGAGSVNQLAPMLLG